MAWRCSAQFKERLLSIVAEWRAPEISKRQLNTSATELRAIVCDATERIVATMLGRRPDELDTELPLMEAGLTSIQIPLLDLELLRLLGTDVASSASITNNLVSQLSDN